MKLKSKHKITKPYPFQRQSAINIEAFDGRALLALEMGLGKSFVSLLWTYWNQNVRPVVIVCPASLKWNWKNECKQHFGINARVLETTTPDLSDCRKKDFLIINYDILHAWVEELRYIRPQLVIADEAHYTKERGARRTKALHALCKGVPHVLALTGTPLTNRPRELWPTLNLLRPDVEFFKTFRAFGDHFCQPRLTPWGWRFDGAENMPELHKLLTDTCMIRVLKKDVLKDLPDKQRIIVPLEIKKRKEYEMAVEHFIAWLSRYSTAKARRAAKAQHLTQITYLKMLAARLKLHNVINWVNDFLEESDEKILLFAHHKEIVSELKKSYKNAIVIDGSTPKQKRFGLVDEFNKNKKRRILIGNDEAAGVGLNMTGASNVGHVEFPWTPAQVNQCVDRAHRIGQKKAVMQYFFVGIGTIDEKMCAILQRKQRNTDQILDGVADMDRLNILDELTDALKIEKLHKKRKERSIL